MAKKNELDFHLPSADDLFSTQEEREDAKLKRIYEISLDEIDPFPKHPFKVKEDEDMKTLVDSIKEFGVLTPATVRKKEDGRYELLSGHRRKRACELAGLDTLRCEVVELDKDAATIFMVDSTPSHAQARKLRALSDKGILTQDIIYHMMGEEKPNQKDRFILKADRAKELFPKNLPISQREDYVVKAMEHYAKYRARREREKER